MSDILLIGNGFDLAHGLPTGYNQFLALLKKWSLFHAVLKKQRRKTRWLKQMNFIICCKT